MGKETCIKNKESKGRRKEKGKKEGRGGGKKKEKRVPFSIYPSFGLISFGNI